PAALRQRLRHDRRSHRPGYAVGRAARPNSLIRILHSSSRHGFPINGHHGWTMPFFDEQGAPLDRIYLVQRSPRHFQLLRPISFLEAGRPESQRIVVPAHDPELPAVGDNQTDLASVPPFLWGLVASYGRQTAAALLHDHLSDVARHGDPTMRIRRRREADRLFGVALLDSGISILRTLIM